MTRTYPRSYTEGLPDYLARSVPAPTASETEQSTKTRGAFLLPNDKLPYMVDVIRAMRLIAGIRTYLEIGTYDKGCLAYVSTLLAPDALLVDVDTEGRPRQTQKLRSFLKKDQRLATVVGDSTSASTLGQIREALGPTKPECVFIDANHTAAYAWADYAMALELVAPGGFVFFHDVYWRGEGPVPGVSDALEWVDRRQPVHVIWGPDPIHRFFPDFWRTEAVWGGVGIIRP